MKMPEIANTHVGCKHEEEITSQVATTCVLAECRSPSADRLLQNENDQLNLEMSWPSGPCSYVAAKLRFVAR